MRSEPTFSPAPSHQFHFTSYIFLITAYSLLPTARFFSLISCSSSRSSHSKPSPFPFRNMSGDPLHFRDQFFFSFISPHTDPVETPPALYFEDDYLEPSCCLDRPFPPDVKPLNIGERNFSPGKFMLKHDCAILQDELAVPESIQQQGDKRNENEKSNDIENRVSEHQLEFILDETPSYSSVENKCYQIDQRLLVIEIELIFEFFRRHCFVCDFPISQPQVPASRRSGWDAPLAHDAQFVTLKVFDSLGREVVMLVNHEMRPGEHTVAFDGSNLASGVYLYRLQAGSFVETKKMVLAK